jgi:hypothetical protein
MTQELRKLAEAASMHGHHIYTHPIDDNNWQANEAWLEAANPAAILELLDRLENAEKELSFLNGDLLYWTERAVGKGSANSDIGEAWERYEAFQRAAMEASK